MNPSTTARAMLTLEDLGIAFPHTREQVTAALIAVVAERGSQYTSDLTHLYEPGVGGCIQGEMLGKLGYPYLDTVTVVGGCVNVARVLGLSHDTTFVSALTWLQRVNDQQGPWGDALAMYEAELAGASAEEQNRRAEDIRSRRDVQEVQDQMKQLGLLTASLKQAAQACHQSIATLTIPVGGTPTCKKKVLTW